ncbi:sulfite exporter TauE/SafE family protein [Candidimonas sp. SYP-B2681]|uniref:sulfite exporter TauE/SafE family protein n=1 Tax=Candidimonas sp. SYP-B2681 TaxID=2497686 RepID=UPI000F88B4C9|nr:sulfite exporter TauE/SafE family protein [Candidimonas sp. SYP-B2681]RTZ45424.1 sulfite exporter TauE/SafE family protein [Candidimonas sp. SYP-B2681]
MLLSDLLPFSDPHLYGLMALLIGGSAFMQGVGGVGFTMFAAPIAAIFCPDLVPGPLLTLGGFVTLLTALREYRAIAWASVGSALGGRAIGTIIAVFAMAHLAQQPLNVLFAVLILIAVVLSAAGMQIATTRSNVGVAGLLSGIMGTLTSVGAPPLAIALQHSSPPTLRATIGAVLFCGSMFSLLMLSVTGYYGRHEVLLSITLLPFMLLGFSLSGRIRKKISPARIRQVLLVFCALSAVGLIVKTIWPDA